LLLGIAFALLGWGGWEGYGRMRAETLRDRLLEAKTDDVPGIIGAMRPYRRWVNPLLEQAQSDAAVSQDRTKQLHVALARLPVDPGQVDYLSDRLLAADARELAVVRDALQGRQEGLTEHFWNVLLKGSSQDQRLRAACALATYTPDDPRWPDVARDIAAKSVTENPVVLGRWLEALRPVRKALLPPLAVFLEDEKRGDADRRISAEVFGTLAEGEAEAFAPLEARLTVPVKPNTAPEEYASQVKRRANTGVALVLLGRDRTWPLLQASPDPTLRSYLIEKLAPSGVDFQVLAERLEQETDSSIRRALLLSLGQFPPERLAAIERERFLDKLSAWYEQDPDTGVHGAVEWLLRRWGQGEKLQVLDQRLRGAPPEKRHWRVNGQGQTMVLVSQPGAGKLGERSQPRVATGDPDEVKRQVKIDWNFAIASKEVTVAQFRRFRKEPVDVQHLSPTEDCPILMVSWYEAAAYCNWLSKQEGLNEKDWCYLPNEKGEYAEGMKLAPDLLKRSGYRLPTEAEWEYACRAGTRTPWSCGATEELLLHYGWVSSNALGRAHPVGQLKPNELGLFDMHGNAWEWCQDGRADLYFAQDQKGREEYKDDKISSKYGRASRGGAFYDESVDARSANRGAVPPVSRDLNVGFRPARTYH
jgi:formylglycine-generating enzyme required for sulfatase activity